MDALHELVRLMHERRDPAAPYAISSMTNDRIQIDIVEVRFHSGDLRQASFACTTLEHVEKSPGPLDGDHSSARTDDLRKIKCGIARPASKIENRLTGPEACALPRVEDTRAPDGVLHAETPHFLVVCAEQVIAFGAQRCRSLSINARFTPRPQR